MPIKEYRPTSPGIRFRKTLVRETTTGNKSVPVKALTRPIKGAVGRSKGRITVRNRQMGHKRKYRVIDFKRDKRDIPARVASLEHDPNRGPMIALVNYADGEKRYILAPEDVKVGTEVLSGENVPFKPGNSLPLSKIPLGMPIHNIELNPGKGGQIVRGAGNSALILAKEGKYVNLKLPSGEIKMVLANCYATVGTLSNADLRHTRAGKAGLNRHKGKRPRTRGVAFSNPSDHPHGGSYKTSGVGMAPKTPWGKPARGVKTRKRKHTEKYKVADRRKKK
jgi:large subunit ribosomal protein L2